MAGEQERAPGGDAEAASLYGGTTPQEAGEEERGIRNVTATKRFIDEKSLPARTRARLTQKRPRPDAPQPVPSPDQSTGGAQPVARQLRSRGKPTKKGRGVQKAMRQLRTITVLGRILFVTWLVPVIGLVLILVGILLVGFGTVEIDLFLTSFTVDDVVEGVGKAKEVFGSTDTWMTFAGAGILLMSLGFFTLIGYALGIFLYLFFRKKR